MTGISIIVVLCVIIYASVYFYMERNSAPSGGVACTLEAKECPDGSYVGRTGPNCEFAACSPANNSTSTATSTLAKNNVEGIVLRGPTCPVERIPPDPACAPRPYQTTISISKSSDPSNMISTVQSNASGTFNTSLSVGKYIFHAASGSLYPRCEDTLVNIVAGTNDITISCDTGIR